MNDTYYAVAYYCLTPLEDVKGHMKKHRAFLESKDAKGRIYFSEDGVNCQMSIACSDFESYRSFLLEDPIYQDVEIKLQHSNKHVFHRLHLRHRPLVAYGERLDLTKKGKYLTPLEWKEWVEKKDPSIVIYDIRNHYEWEIGHFEGAKSSNCSTFREFKELAETIAETTTSDQKVLIYCTGGIRCELFSSLLQEQGIEEVYQLHGGVIGYGNQVGNQNWDGYLFVFDDRLVVPLSSDPHTPISLCFHCKNLESTHFNCANMDCNKLFPCCKPCLHAKKGCCSVQCLEEGRVRPYKEDATPFRKLSASCALEWTK